MLGVDFGSLGFGLEMHFGRTKRVFLGNEVVAVYGF
jgi:hypothetical protein